MAEEFQAEIYGGSSWWSSPRSTYGGCWQNDFINEESNYNQTLPENLINFPANDQDSSNFDMDQQQTSNFIISSDDCIGNLVSSSYGYPSNLLQTLFDGSPAPPPSPPQQGLYDFQANLDDFNLVSKQDVLGGLHWNTSALDLNDNRTGFFGSNQSRFLSSTYEEKHNCSKIKSKNEEIRGLGSPTFKRPRLETPSPMPTFKVRKEKLGDRVTALQQLVSPFGKTDTASVLHEAIEYIKLLQDQVNVLSTPYMKNGVTMQRPQIHEKVKEIMDVAKQQDLRSRGLCLVRVSSTFPVSNETAPDYWTSILRNTFK